MTSVESRIGLCREIGPGHEWAHLGFVTTWCDLCGNEKETMPDTECGECLARAGREAERIANKLLRDQAELDAFEAAVNGPWPGEESEDDGSFINWDAFWSKDDSSEEWLAYPLVPARRGVAIYAKAKTGKSLLLLDIAAALASGRSCLGQPAKPPIHVMYLDYEMTQEDLYDRLVDMGYGHDVDLSRLHYASMPPISGLDTADGAAKVIALAEKCQAQMVVVDTLSRVITTSEEKDSKGVLALYRYLGGPLKAKGITLLRLDHAGKELGQGARGSSAKNEDVDLVWELTLIEGGVRLRCTHARMSWAGGTKDFARLEDPFRHELLKESVAYPDGTKEVAALMDKLGLPVDTTKRQASLALREAGQGRRNALIVAAIAWRKAEQPAFVGLVSTPKVVPGTTPTGTPGTNTGDHYNEKCSEQVGDQLGTTGDQPLGQVGTTGGVGTTPRSPAPADDPDDDDLSLM